jgi:hypothetical protein
VSSLAERVEDGPGKMAKQKRRRLFGAEKFLEPSLKFFPKTIDGKCRCRSRFNTKLRPSLT